MHIKRSRLDIIIKVTVVRETTQQLVFLVVEQFTLKADKVNEDNKIINKQVMNKEYKNSQFQLLFRGSTHVGNNSKAKS